MPTDLTGTPTSLGIGTYNVDNDAPSGLGFNAAMAQIDALIASRLATPGGILAGEVPVWNGSTWVRSSTLGMSAAGISGFPSDQLKNLLGDGSWAWPHTYITSITRTTADAKAVTTFGTSSSFFASNLTFTADGTSTYIAEFFCPQWANSSATANSLLAISLDGGATEAARIAVMTSATAGAAVPVDARHIWTPSAGVQTVQVRQYVGGGTATLTPGASGVGANCPAFMGIRRL